MISAMVLAPAGLEPSDASQARVARSLGWLIPAVIGGAVRDVVLAGPPRLNLDRLADRVGCELVQGSEPFRAGVAACRCDAVLVLLAGYRPLGPLVEELEGWEEASAGATMRLAVVPQTLLQRLWPDLAPTIGILARKEACRAERSFADLARRSRKATLFGTRVEPIP